jgi:hypothetical protein
VCFARKILDINRNNLAKKRSFYKDFKQGARKYKDDFAWSLSSQTACTVFRRIFGALGKGINLCSDSVLKGDNL